MIEIKATNTQPSATIHLPGSKSISNRLLILKQVLQTNTIFNNLSSSNDTNNLIAALSQISESNTNPIDVGHAGTNMRFLTALLSATPGTWTITGSERMCERPINDLVDALNQLGANIQYLAKQGFPPLKINGKRLEKNTCTINASTSSQFVSALLLISPLLPNGLHLQLQGNQVSKPYKAMTIAVLKKFGIEVSSRANEINVSPVHNHLHFPKVYDIESDWSSASYWYSICALSKNANIALRQMHQSSLQADAVIQHIMESLGVHSAIKDQTLFLSRTERKAQSLVYDCMACPDIAQTLAVLGVGLGIEVKLTGLSTLKIKETDRLLALKNEIEKFGAKVNIDASSIHILPLPPEQWRHQSFLIKTYHDHRMALSFAPLALCCKGIAWEDDHVINKSYPSFTQDLKSAGFNVNLLP